MPWALLSSSRWISSALRLDGSVSSGGVKMSSRFAGWRDHAPLYKQVIDRFESADLERAKKTVTGVAGLQDDLADMARTEWKQEVLPLCWEILLKFSSEWPAGLKGDGEAAASEAWRITAAVRMISGPPMQ